MSHKNTMPASTVAGRLELRDPALSLRPVTTADDPFLRFLNAQERGAPYAGLGLPDTLLEKILATHLRAQTDGYVAQYRRAEQLMIHREGEPIGRLWLTLEPAPLGQGLRIIDMVLREEVRNNGIGRDILCSLVDSARSIGIARVTLSAFAANERAIKLCKRIGFRLVGGTDEVGNIAMVYPLT
jgi:RimJ/RimL family protein N-acetyltransferase